MNACHLRIAMVLAVGTVTAASAQPAFDLDRTVRAVMAEHHVPGLAVAMGRDGAAPRASVFGLANLEQESPVAADSVFEIGSISKSITAVAVMALVEDGRLDLDAPIAKYLTGTPERWRAITVRHLLTHTAGLWDWDGKPEFSYRREYTGAEYMEMLAAHPPASPPGAVYPYTNGGYPLLGLIVARVTGGRYEDFVAERVFRRARLTHTRFRNARDVVKGRADGYLWTDDRWQHGEVYRPSVIAPNGGILSTAPEMATLVTELAAGRILQPATLKTMWTPPKLADGTTSIYALGWFVQMFEGHRVIHHIGETVGGHSSSLQYFPDDRLVVAVAANSSGVLPIYLLSRTVARAAFGGYSMR